MIIAPQQVAEDEVSSNGSPSNPPSLIIREGEIEKEVMKKTSNVTTAFLLLLFYVGWAKFSVGGDGVYIADYVLRIFIIVVIWKERHVFLSKPQWPEFMLWMLFFVFLVNDLFLYRIVFRFDSVNHFNELLFSPTTYPPIKDGFLLFFDLTVGIFMVALTEEFLFRYKISKILEDREVGLFSRYLITSLLFSSIHLPQGMVSLVSTFIWGLVLFYLYTKSKSIHFVVLLHFITNFVIFGIKALEN